ncbi:MAG: class I SAM-dependent methyltransferase [Sphingorhabdus sp.]|uniref:class I SAM-dependent methyltransferase n=1 Tax=Sphingorhabdus sp. TaxID=1902408 RepID=UPI0038FCC5C5
MSARHLALLSSLVILGGLGLASCQQTVPENGRSGAAGEFPSPYRPVSEAGDTQFSNEAARDEAGEAQFVMDWAGIKLGTTVADIGAGEGYYTIRLAERVGPKGRVLAQDINRGALDRLGERVTREQLDNVAIKEGAVDDPRLPENSFDRIFMIHMYHEVDEPYAFLWRLRPALAKGGEVIVVDRDRATDQHGIPPKLLFCEFAAVGYRLTGFSEELKLGGYIARFSLSGPQPAPAEIKTCGTPPQK